MRSAWRIRVLRFTELWITYTEIVPELSGPILESRCVAFSHCVLDTAQGVQWPFKIPIRYGELDGPFHEYLLNLVSSRAHIH